MRIVYIAAGAAGSYCGACTRDVDVVRGLRDRGHDVLMVPLYTPLQTDGPDPSTGHVYYGGVNVYLQQHVGLFRHTPAMLDRWLDSPGLLRWVSRRSVSTEAADLGPMTVSVLQGADGRQRKELRRLVRFLKREARPDVIVLTNSLLSGLAPALRDEVGSKVVCALQGEETFVSELGAPHADEARTQIRLNAEAVDLFVATSPAHAREMAAWLDVDPERVEVLPAGVQADTYAPTAARRCEPFRVASLSRLSPEKGLDVLFDAFPRLAGRALLTLAGQVPGAQAAFWRDLQSQAQQDGWADRLDYRGVLDMAGKVAFLHEANVFVLASRIPERRGMAVLEALAAGVPVVVSDRGGLPEIVERTGGGVVVPAEDASALADALTALCDDPARADRLGAAGREGVQEHFSASAMVERTVRCFERLLEGGRGQGLRTKG